MKTVDHDTDHLEDVIGDYKKIQPFIHVNDTTAINETHEVYAKALSLGLELLPTTYVEVTKLKDLKPLVDEDAFPWFCGKKLWRAHTKHLYGECLNQKLVSDGAGGYYLYDK